MKKLFALLLAALMCLSICACAAGYDVAEVEEALDQTGWSGADGAVFWAFAGGKVGVVTEIAGIEMEDYGSYEVTEKYIKLDWDDPDNGRVDKIYYTYKDGEIVIYPTKAKDDPLTLVKKG